MRTTGQPVVTVNRRPLNPRFDLRNHSPDGFERGYAGSGPAQLALALLSDCLGDDHTAAKFYQDFKFGVVAKLAHDRWTLTDTLMRQSVQALHAASQEGDAMDVHCSTCGEPWDVRHLRHDAIFETDLDPAKAEAWTQLPAKLRLAPRYREKFEAAGYQFGASFLDVIHCPACPKGAQPDPEKAAVKAELVQLMGDDEDGLASTLEDFGLRTHKPPHLVNFRWVKRRKAAPNRQAKPAAWRTPSPCWNI